jgi:sigma-B regulation protein RsbU (phosphoserine phosphatase)
MEFVWRLESRAELAGDTLNIFSMDADHVGFYLLDVSGRGVSAALMAVALSRVMMPAGEQASLLMRSRRADGTERIVSPARVAARLNGRFTANLIPGQFFTLLYGVLDVRSAEWTYVAAGHPGPILLSGGEAQLLAATGPPIGVAKDVVFEERTVRLEPGSRLVLYSDGIIEARNGSGELFGTDRLLELLMRGGRRPLRQSLPLVIEWVRRWTGRPALDDDASCLALEISERTS